MLLMGFVYSQHAQFEYSRTCHCAEKQFPNILTLATVCEEGAIVDEVEDGIKEHVEGAAEPGIPTPDESASVSALTWYTLDFGLLVSFHATYMCV